MKPTIKNKLVGGFSAVLFLMVVVAAIGVYSVLSLRTSALETARVGDRLNSIALEIQVPYLEAQRKIKSYLAEFKQLIQPMYLQPQETDLFCRALRQLYGEGSCGPLRPHDLD